jgi:hypothetical protein
MQLLLSRDELQLLADLLEKRNDAISNSVLDRIIAHDLAFGCDELDFLCDMLKELKLACMEGKADPVFQKRFQTVQSALDKLAVAAAMV